MLTRLKSVAFQKQYSVILLDNTCIVFEKLLSYTLFTRYELKSLIFNCHHTCNILKMNGWNFMQIP